MNDRINGAEIRGGTLSRRTLTMVIGWVLWGFLLQWREGRNHGKWLSEGFSM